jgi:type II secretory pathway component PulC
VSPIIEFIFELAEMNTLYAIYSGLIIGLAFKLLWSWNHENLTSTTHPKNSNEKITQSSQIVLKINQTRTNPLLTWIIQIVRCKEGLGDESDSSLFY